jgi:hypothetical protein
MMKKTEEITRVNVKAIVRNGQPYQAFWGIQETGARPRHRINQFTFPDVALAGAENIAFN